MNDPYTTEGPLCDADGIVRASRPMHHGKDYPCTGHAHYAGEHIRCTSPGHAPQPQQYDPDRRDPQAASDKTPQLCKAVHRSSSVWCDREAGHKGQHRGNTYSNEPRETIRWRNH